MPPRSPGSAGASGSAGAPVSAGSGWPTVLDFLVELTGDEPGLRRRIAAREVVLADGTPVEEGTPYLPGEVVHLYRDLPVEVEVPGEIPVLLRDDECGLLVVDKPPFLATMPRGSHVAQTVVVRLRRELGLPDLTPVHRLDRLTSGVLLLTTRPEARSPYQRMVQAGGLDKTYEALAPVRSDLPLPTTVANRIVKDRGTPQARVEEGHPNAITRVELHGTLGTLGHYRLLPATGRTHQLRVHLAGLGVPIAGDPLYPVARDVDPTDLSTPLQLLARAVTFQDPVSGVSRTVTSRRTLPIPGYAVPTGDADRPASR